jgi:hypothetical protein
MIAVLIGASLIFAIFFMFPMGTYALGYDTGMKVLQGAKFTLISVYGGRFSASS